MEQVHEQQAERRVANQATNHSFRFWIFDEHGKQAAIVCSRLLHVEFVERVRDQRDIFGVGCVGDKNGGYWRAELGLLLFPGFGRRWRVGGQSGIGRS
jgi:hypothetical protein